MTTLPRKLIVAFSISENNKENNSLCINKTKYWFSKNSNKFKFNKILINVSLKHSFLKYMIKATI